MPSDVPFRELRKLLESHGWKLDRINGSHHVFVRAGQRPMVIPVHKSKVRFQYDRQARQRIAQADDAERKAREEGGE